MMDSELRDLDQDAPISWHRWALASVILSGLAFVVGWLAWPKKLDQPAEPQGQPDATTVVMAPYQHPDTSGYVGSDVCAQCHGKIAESYKTHPMAQSLARIDPKAPLPAEGTIAGKQRVLSVDVQDGVMYHHEKMFDSDEKLIYDQPFQIDYSVGSGRRAKAYLHQRGETLFMSPINWYAQSQTWGLAPNYQPDDSRRFDRRVNDECLSCHAGRLLPVGRSLDRYQPAVFQEMSIGCENCHGPGAAHVARHETKSTSTEGADTIVNPAKLDASRRESVCNQCHLQVAVRLPRFGRSHLDFRPGQNIEDIWTMLDTDVGVTNDGRTRSVNHVQQMRGSQCYLRSDGRFGCTSCHDPHRVPAETERVAFYRTKCLQCHSQNGCSLPPERRAEKQDSCIACHMPERKSQNISHVTQTDHRILRTANPSDDNEKGGRREELAFFNPDDLQTLPWERERALTLGAWIYLTKADRKPPNELARSLMGVVKKFPGDGLAWNMLGSMAVQNGLMERALEYYSFAVEIPASKEEALQGLLGIYYSGLDWPHALECADKLLEIDSGNAKVHALRGDILSKLLRTEEAIDAARQALKANPSLLPVREWLADAYRQANRREEQQSEEELIGRIKQAKVPPHRK